MSTKSPSVTSGVSSPRRITKAEKISEPINPQEMLNQRFESMLFSLYKPQIRPHLDDFVESGSNTSFKPLIEQPKFDSPVCTFRLNSSLDDSDDKNQDNEKIKERTNILASEIQLDNYISDFSVVPFNYERKSFENSSVNSFSQEMQRISPNNARAHKAFTNKKWRETL